MRRLALGVAIGALVFGSAAAGAKIAAHGLDVNGSVHATGDVTGDTGLSTTLGGVDTNYVNVNNAAGGVRWQFAQLLYGDTDPSVTGRAAPAPSLLLERTPSGGSALWFKSGAADTAWTLVAGTP